MSRSDHELAYVQAPVDVGTPGRCAVTLEIPALAAGEAARWLADRDHGTPIGGPATLAELYAVLRGDDPPAPRRAVGFAC